MENAKENKMAITNSGSVGKGKDSDQEKIPSDHYMISDCDLDDLLDMKMNQVKNTKMFQIVRVPGGWLYCQTYGTDRGGRGHLAPVFVAEPKPV